MYPSLYSRGDDDRYLMMEKYRRDDIISEGEKDHVFDIKNMRRKKKVARHHHRVYIYILSPSHII